MYIPILKKCFWVLAVTHTRVLSAAKRERKAIRINADQPMASLTTTGAVKLRLGSHASLAYNANQRCVAWHSPNRACVPCHRAFQTTTLQLLLLYEAYIPYKYVRYVYHLLPTHHKRVSMPTGSVCSVHNATSPPSTSLASSWVKLNVMS